MTSDAGAELAREVFVVEIRTWSPNDRVSRSKRRLLVSKVVPWLFHTTEAPLRNRHCRYDTNPAPATNPIGALLLGGVSIDFSGIVD